MNIPALLANSCRLVPCTGEKSTLPYVLAFLAVGILLFVIMLILKRKSR